MTLKECYAALELEEGATLSEVKRAYRRLAFTLHPDLNPDTPDASRRFQQANEAYVTLSRSPLVAGTRRRERADERADPRAREEAHKAYRRAAGKSAGDNARATGSSSPDPASGADNTAREDMLKDILNDPFARRVFEDIYSHIRHKSRGGDSSAHGRRVGASSSAPRNTAPETVPDEGLVDRFKGWLRRQIDDEQVLRMPGSMLVPGARVRLRIQHGFTADPQTVEITLPPEFIPGRSVRLRGMGKRLGKWRGDLYVRIEKE